MNSEKKEIAAIILAAGEGQRIGQNKALLKLRGASFLEVIAENLKKLDFDKIYVVGGSQWSEVRLEAIRLGINFVLNKNWEQGQFSSLKSALSVLNSEIGGALVTLVDHPFVAPGTYKHLLETWQKFTNRIVIPVYDNRRGHPIIITQHIIRESLESSEENNLKELIKNHERMVIRLKVNDPGILQDIDTQDDFDKAKKS
jgi:molybdenum cofactor cytidylyltransferase